MTTINVFDQGDLVRASGILQDSAGLDTDPAAVVFKYRTPAGVVTTYTYPIDAALVKDSTGNYHVDIDCSQHGIYRYRFASTGSGQAAAERQFRVKPSGLD